MKKLYCRSLVRKKDFDFSLKWRSCLSISVVHLVDLWSTCRSFINICFSPYWSFFLYRNYVLLSFIVILKFYFCNNIIVFNVSYWLRIVRNEVGVHKTFKHEVCCLRLRHSYPLSGRLPTRKVSVYSECCTLMDCTTLKSSLLQFFFFIFCFYFYNVKDQWQVGPAIRGAGYSIKWDFWDFDCA